MTRWIALLRGVNVGGHGKLPMADLRRSLSEAGFGNPRTYIQSGNIVFDSEATDDLPGRIGDLIARGFDLRPTVFVLSRAALDTAIARCPFGTEPSNRVHLWFLSGPAQPDTGRLAHLAAPSETWRLEDSVLYLSAPDGIGRSRFAAGAEAALGIPATARNLRTVLALQKMAHTD